MKTNCTARDNFENFFTLQMLKKLDFFKRLKKIVPEEVYKKVFFELRYEYINRHKVVYNNEEEGKKAYIILEGEAYVLTPKNNLLLSSQLERAVEEEDVSCDECDECDEGVE